MRRIAIFGCYVVATIALAVLVAVGVALTKLYRARWPEEASNGNCCSFAVPKFLQDPRRAALVVNLSRHTLVPHVRFMPHTEGVYFEELVPLHPKRGWKGVLDSFWFKGRIRRGSD